MRHNERKSHGIYKSILKEMKMEISKQTFNKSTSIGKIAEALAKAQLAMPKLIATEAGQVGQAKYQYANLAGVLEACKKHLNDNNIAIVQAAINEGDSLYGASTMLIHSSSEWLESSLMLKPVKKVKGGGLIESVDPQTAGICISYARRYNLAAMVGLAQEDDDAASAMPASRNKALTKPKPQPEHSNPHRIKDKGYALLQAKSCTSLGELIEVHKLLCASLQEELKEEFGEIKNNLSR